MSQITKVMLTCDRTDHNQVEKLKAWLSRRHGSGLVRVDHHAGGDKVFDVNLYVGAFNLLDIDGFFKHIKKQKWNHPDGMKLFISSENNEDGNGFLIYTFTAQQ